MSECSRLYMGIAVLVGAVGAMLFSLAIFVAFLTLVTGG